MLLLAIRLGLGAVFAAAAVGKALDLQGSRRAVAAFGVPKAAAPALGTILPVLEAAVAVALVPAGTARAGAAVALVALAAFCAAIARSMRRAEAPDCHCFGQLHSKPVERSTLVRNGALAAAAVAVLLLGPGPSLTAVPATSLALVLMSLVAAGLLVATATLWRENRRLRALPATRAAEPERDRGLPLGSPAPALTLAAPDGAAIALHARLTAGRPAVLVHVSPRCGPCRDMLPELARWTRQLSGSLDIVTLSSGARDQNHELVRDVPDHELLLAEPGAFVAAYRMAPTPSAVALSRDGRIASRPASGVLAIEGLIRGVLARPGAHDSPVRLNVISGSGSGA